MSLLSVVKEVCARVGVAVPSQVVPAINANRTMQEMLACANEMAQRIAADTREWRQLKATVIYTGDGHWVVTDPGPPIVRVWTGTSAFNLPANYRRMLLTSNVWLSTSTMQPMRFIADTDEWMQRRASVENDAWGEWTLIGDQIHIWPIMAGYIPPVLEDPGPPFIPARPAVPAVTARFSYLDKNCIALAPPNTGYGDTFLNDADTFRLDERLLKLGMIFDWKQAKGSPYAEDMGTWSDAMAIAMGSDKPMPIMVGRSPISANARVAYPWTLPTP
jgi:hypothetical protein